MDRGYPWGCKESDITERLNKHSGQAYRLTAFFFFAKAEYKNKGQADRLLKGESVIGMFHIVITVCHGHLENHQRHL